jgi:hypothetical protein
MLKSVADVEVELAGSAVFDASGAGVLELLDLPFELHDVLLEAACVPVAARAAMPLRIAYLVAKRGDLRLRVLVALHLKLEEGVRRSGRRSRPPGKRQSLVEVPLAHGDVTQPGQCVRKIGKSLSALP